MTLDTHDRQIIGIKVLIRALDGPVKTSTVRNHIDGRPDSGEARQILDGLMCCGFLTRQKVRQVYVYTITDAGRDYVNNDAVRRMVE